MTQQPGPGRATGRPRRRDWCARRHSAGTVQCRDHTACRHRCSGGGERSDRQPRPQREAGRRRHHSPVRAGRTRRARLRASGAVAAAQRGPGGPHHPGAGEPDIPGPGPGHRPGTDQAGLHPRTGHPDARRLDRGRADGDARRPRSGRHHLRLRSARGHQRRHAALRAPAGPGRPLRPGRRFLPQGPGALHLPRRPGRGEPVGHAPGLPGPHPHRPRARARSASFRSSARSRASSARCRTSSAWRRTPSRRT